MGLLVIRWPSLIDPESSGPATAATLAGALIGASAVFAGAQINEYARRQEARIQLQNQQRRARAIIDNEFIRVCLNLIEDAGVLVRLRKQSLRTMDFKEPLRTPIFDDLKSEMLCLPENEIDALFTFYAGLDATRRSMRDTSRAPSFYAVAKNMHLDLKAAEEVARKIWPTRKVQLPGGQTVRLADNLSEQAAAVAKALEDWPK
jgi:hypothetical protein